MKSGDYIPRGYSLQHFTWIDAGEHDTGEQDWVTLTEDDMPYIFRQICDGILSLDELRIVRK
jgi:hypothetical protein